MKIQQMKVNTSNVSIQTILIHMKSHSIASQIQAIIIENKVKKATINTAKDASFAILFHDSLVNLEKSIVIICIFKLNFYLLFLIFFLIVKCMKFI